MLYWARRLSQNVIHPDLLKPPQNVLESLKQVENLMVPKVLHLVTSCLLLTYMIFSSSITNMLHSNGWFLPFPSLINKTHRGQINGEITENQHSFVLLGHLQVLCPASLKETSVPGLLMLMTIQGNLWFRCEVRLQPF